MADAPLHIPAALLREHPHQDAIAFCCPLCGTALEQTTQTELRCPIDGISYTRQEGIWCLLRPDRLTHFQPFLQEYEAIRRAEGRGSDEAAYFRALPFEDTTGRFKRDWLIRAKSFETLLRHVVQPLEEIRARPLTALDLGAGNGWLSNRLALRGHCVAAVDLQTHAVDGLGAHRHYEVSFCPVQAEFDALPFGDGLFDLAVFNASLHYALHYTRTLHEALRVLRPHGRLVILDSPLYRQATSGVQMVREREAYFERTYGFRSNALPSENYLTEERLAQLATTFELQWEHHTPFYGWRWALRPWVARLLGRREPARFVVLVGKRHAAPSLALQKPTAPSRVPQGLWRRLLRWRFRLFQRHRYDQRVVEKIQGRAFIVLPKVFNPKLFRTGAFWVEALNEALIPPTARVLDMGTGTGIAAITAARWSTDVTAIDINPHAIRCAHLNAEHHGVADRVTIYEGDLFAPVAAQRFDVVLFNPPFFRGVPHDDLDRAWRSEDVVERFAAALPGHLAPGGYALVLLSTDGDTGAFLQAFQAQGLSIAPVAHRNLINERLTLYRLSTTP